jgi:hypothetical protein
MSYLYSLSYRCGRGDLPIFCTAVPPASCGNHAVGSVGLYLTPVILLVLRYVGVVYPFVWSGVLVCCWHVV